MLRASGACCDCWEATEEREVVSDGDGSVVIEVCGALAVELGEEGGEEGEVVSDFLEPVVIEVARAGGDGVAVVADRSCDAFEVSRGCEGGCVEDWCNVVDTGTVEAET